jgi:hypothetical protein
MEHRDQNLYRVRKFGHKDIVRFRYSYSFRYVVFLNGKMIGSGQNPKEAALEILYDYLKGSTIGRDEIFQSAARNVAQIIYAENIKSKKLKELLSCSLCGITIREIFEVREYLDGLKESKNL